MANVTLNYLRSDNTVEETYYLAESAIIGFCINKRVDRDPQTQKVILKLTGTVDVGGESITLTDNFNNPVVTVTAGATLEEAATEIAGQLLAHPDFSVAEVDGTNPTWINLEYAVDGRHDLMVVTGNSGTFDIEVVMQRAGIDYETYCLYMLSHSGKHLMYSHPDKATFDAAYPDIFTSIGFTPGTALDVKKLTI